MKFKRVTVKKNERGLLLRNGDFERVLQPGRHWLWEGFDTLRVETFALEQPAFTHGLADYLMAKEPAKPSKPSSCASSSARLRSACAARTACWSRCWRPPPAACTGRAWSTCKWR
jgi:hypothetical protein